MRENFCVEDVLTHFEDGKLEKWLDAWNYRQELETVRGLKASGKTNAREVLSELMRIFGAGMNDAEIDSELEVYDYCEERRKFWEYVKSNGLQELEELRKKCADLQSERDTLRKRCADLQSERDTLRKMFADLQKIFERQGEPLAVLSMKLCMNLHKIVEGDNYGNSKS